MVSIWQNRTLRNKLFLGLSRGITVSLGAIAFSLFLTSAVYAEAELNDADPNEQPTEAIAPPQHTDFVTELDQDKCDHARS